MLFTQLLNQPLSCIPCLIVEAIYSKEDLESFLKEAEIMKHFDHVNVVKLLGMSLSLLNYVIYCLVSRLKCIIYV